MTAERFAGAQEGAGAFRCRSGCGACCIAPSIHRPFYGMPQGKPAGTPCVHLSDDMRCSIFGDPRRPDVCSQFVAEISICGGERDEAIQMLRLLEDASRPDAAGNIA